MKILVTGGAGYIGSHVCKALAAKGHEPVAYDNLSRGNAWAVKWGPLERGDIADTARLSEVMARYEPAAVMHFAAYAYVGESCAEPLLYYRNNVGGSEALLRTIAAQRPLPVVFSSSCATYGIPHKAPIAEDHPQNPVNPYGYTKLVVERMLADLDRAAGLRSVALRYFNAAGADPDGEIGEAHDPETHLIPLVLAAADARGAIDVYGTDYDTPDGTCVRDYVHVVDLADAHVRALEYLLAGGASLALNLANARGHSVREVIAAAEEVCGISIRANDVARRPGDPPILVGDATRARALLGWIPLRSELRTQLTDAWRWMQASGAGAPQRQPTALA
jgi:UDP-glucose-4-epimerase GalE